jgi:membrane associated rhomboid family serine protease
MAQPALRALGATLLTLLLGASVYLGFSSGPRDIRNTVAFGQRMVGALVTGYGIVGLLTLLGLWRKQSWSRVVLWLWAILVVGAATLAALVYGGGVRGTLLAAAGSGVISGAALWIGLSLTPRVRQSPSPSLPRHN